MEIMMGYSLNIEISFSRARKLGFVILYGVMSAGLALLIAEFVFRQQMLANVIQLLHSGDKSLIETAVLYLILIFSLFSIYMIYTTLRLLILCWRIQPSLCRIAVTDGVLRYSTPDLAAGWHPMYSSGQIVIPGDEIDSIDAVEVWSRRQLIPERSIIIRFKTGKFVSIDVLFFKGTLTAIREIIHDAVFPDEEAISISSDAQSILDENGNFIQPS